MRDKAAEQALGQAKGVPVSTPSVFPPKFASNPNDTTTPTDTVDELGNIIELIWRDELTKAEAKAALKALIARAVTEARSKDPFKCEQGHEVYGHNTADGWCCACEADIAFLNAQIEAKGEKS